MNLQNLEENISINLKDKTDEIKRVFHGRGNFYDNFSFLTVDSLDNTLFATFYEENSEELEIIKILKNLTLSNNFQNLIVQRKYKNSDFFESIYGEIPENFYAIENGLKYKIDFRNRNIGLFFDMKNTREYIKNISKNKSILNLFSYTCAFSVTSIFGGASKVVNIDMGKNSLSIGRQNHHINGLETKNVKFLPHNILKSFGRIKSESPFDIIIIDPPSFQKGSFVATNDYVKIVKRLDSFSNKGSLIVACLNDPFLTSSYLKEIFKEFAPDFKFIKRIENPKEFVSNSDENGLKVLIFEKI
ncbi:class I SAM-dependent methyltransferase [Aliarcobacter cibarius]|jgi:23S rRNA (cytosine1962-C5)-methyltransferase|uniref:SAM-dependent methyltransferase n=1 Tax=Aliarcobacter cibarius TaxID=255507 RepID=A0A5J6RHQ4_9BACT|nr:class I SAM-dependent methyltransferase [Aliarcobacter cibarius]QEZ88903.1 SAM-dependent methyltransferase [Aliarcobacter cibarius]QKJ26947.1 SAM-dependent methyltransferase [Aliarcobacter cibarius]TLS97775.1 SAM-dependent methyltransferase [Aliarcobacter cibarius]TLS98525.1 SAM-dependent methyltransferase [Aliarcobacter cibarius]TLT02514.1 SAM-dependent methyltransferase [Aliarcobacter cibarius]